MNRNYGVNRNYVLDACALIALVKKEPGYDIVAALYEDAQFGGAEIVINVVNLLEVYYGFRRERGVDYADAVVKNIDDSIITVSDVSRVVMREAGRIKAYYKRVSLADSIALAEASVRGGFIVTSDHHEMDRIEKGESGIKFLWIR